MLFPFIGMVFSLTLWGSFYPVPWTTNAPHERFKARLSSAVKTGFVAVGMISAANKTSTAIVQSPSYQHAKFGGFSAGVSHLMGFEGGSELDRIIEESSSSSMRPTRVIELVPGLYGMDEQTSTKPSAGHATGSQTSCITGALMISLTFGLGLVFSPCKLEDVVDVLDRVIEPMPKSTRHFGAGVSLTMDSNSEVAIEFVPDLINTVIKEIEPEAEIEKQSSDVVTPVSPAGDDKPATTNPTITAPMVAPCFWVHPIVIKALFRLVRLQAVDLPLLEPVYKAEDQVFSAGLAPFDSISLPQTRALVRWRMENISPFVMVQLIQLLLVNCKDGKVQVECQAAPLKKKRKNQKQRRRIWARDTRARQEEIIKKLEEEAKGEEGV